MVQNGLTGDRVRGRGDHLVSLPELVSEKRSAGGCGFKIEVCGEGENCEVTVFLGKSENGDEREK